MTASAAERRLAYLALAAMPFLFTANVVFGRAAVETTGPWTLAFFRWLLASLILVAVSWRGLVAFRDRLLAQWPTLVLLGVLGMVVCGSGVYIGLKHTTATNGTLIYTSSAVLIVLLDWLVRGTRLSVAGMIGMVLGFAGVVVIVVKGDLAILAGLQFNVGDLLFAAATVAWSVYSIILKRPVFEAVPTVALFAAIAIAGTLVLAPGAAIEIAVTGDFPLTSKQWLAITGLAIGPSALAFSAYQYGLKILGPGVASVFTYLMPPAGVSMAILFLGEELHGFHIAGFVLILAGVVLATAPIPALKAGSAHPATGRS